MEIQNNKKLKKSLAIISIVYLMSQGFILVLTGTWWDEKTWFFSTYEQMWNVALQLGKPSSFFVIAFLTAIPEFVGRILIFIFFYLSAIIMYFLYRELPFVDSEDALLMAILYTVIPANDARALRGVFPYSLGFILFLFGFYLLINLQKKYQYKNRALRGAVILIFICSFTLNSLLVFYLIPLCYILIYLVKTKNIRIWYKYIDFLLIPFVYFGVKNLFFPAYGIYEGYNSVSIANMFKSTLLSIEECIYVLKGILHQWRMFLFAGAAVAIVMQKIVYRYIKGGEKAYTKKCILLAIGLFITYLGIFPYTVIGQKVWLVGVAGRSSILISVGMAIVIYALILWIPLKRIRVYIYSVIVICGILHFNYFYLLYQQDYYIQLDFMQELAENYEVLEEKKNMIYLTDYHSEIDVTRFYSLNSNAAQVFKDQSRFIMYNKSDLDYLTDEKQLYAFVNEGDYQMRDYEIGKSNEIEALLNYINKLSLKDTLRLKILEITNHEKFEDVLYKNKNLEVILDTSEYFDLALNEAISDMY